MQEFEDFGQNVRKHRDCVIVLFLILGIEHRLAHFDIPIAELAPHEVVKSCRGKSDFVFIKVYGDFLDNVVESCENPLIRAVESRWQRQIVVVLYIHNHESRSVPKFIHEVSATLDFAVGKSRIAAGRNTRCKRESESVRAVLVDDFERIDTVSEAL